jgi:CspA family cold shock protein
MKTGTVKFFNEAKGFGFITDDTTREEFFVHVTGLNGGQIQQNDRVEFETQEGRKGVNAVNVRRICCTLPQAKTHLSLFGCILNQLLHHLGQPHYQPIGTGCEANLAAKAAGFV